MCIQDIAISRHSYPILHSDTSDVSGNVTIPPNPRRIALYFTTTTPSAMIVQLAKDASTGYNIASAQVNQSSTDSFTWNPQFAMTYQTHPGILQNQLIIRTGIFSLYNWVEVVTDDVIDEIIQREFKRHG